nr:resolvase, N terminal domain protein [uncultured bacterium]
MRTGAFCFFQLFSEKRTQEPSPERVRSERGREDKPLTPVLYSTREGGELYGAIFQRPGFQAMLADIEAGKVGTVIVKDMSRLGRNYLQVGFYTETLWTRTQKADRETGC